MNSFFRAINHNFQGISLEHHQSKLNNQICATKKCTLLNFVKSWEIRQGGDDTFL